MEVVAIDISGRHAEGGRYIMVCAAVSADISPIALDRVHEVRQIQRTSRRMNLNVVVDVISDAVQGLDGLVIAEQGDLYNIEAWRIESILGRRFKYPESLGERLLVELAHHISISGRRMLLGFGED
ncbi:MAG: DUF2209 domain-containing protein [Methanotrichaceae archaeon]|nr:DUF2209 domain-containing protein [Methanotrichaceae archaeon]